MIMNLSDYPGKAGMNAGGGVRNFIGRIMAQGIIIPQQVIVPDISFYQETCNFEQMKSNGAAGVIIRAGQNLWKDPKFDTFWADAKAAGLPRGTYWFYDSRVSPKQQADLFYSIFEADMPEMEIVADYEESYGGPYGGWQNLYDFIMRLNSHGVPLEKIAIYTGYYYWIDHSPQNDPSALVWFKQFRLWLAWYTSNPANVSIPAPWTNDDLLLWQYTSTGPGPAYGVGSLGIDLSYFNGTLADFEARYPMDGGTEPPPIDPPPSGGEMQEKIYDNGVRKITGELQASNVRTLIFPPAAIASTGYLYKPGECRTADSLDGYDFVANFTPFNVSTCRVNLGLRMNGVEYEVYHNYNPYLVLDGVPFITHVAKQFKNYRNASQGFRYIIENGVKNPNANSDWNALEARRLVGTLADGSLVVVSVAPLSYPGGWSLHQAADYGLSLGCNMMIDGDSGRSTQDYLLVNGQKDVFWGTPYHDSVPAFLYVKLKEALTDEGGPVEPPPGDAPYMLEYDADGTFTGNKWVLENS